MNWKSQLLHVCLGMHLLCCFATDVLAQESVAAEKTMAKVEQDKPKADEQEDVKDPYSEMTLDEISKDFGAKMSAYTKSYRAAKTIVEKRNVYKTLPKVEPYWPRLGALIVEANGADAGIEVVKWWYRRGGRNKGSVKISRLLVENCLQNEGFNKFAFMIRGALSRDEAEVGFRSVLEKSTLESVRATACYELHEVLRERAEGLTGEAAESILAEAKSLRELIGTTYPTAVDGVGAVYADLLAAVDFAKKLEVGQPVPDIEGVDIDGTDFKLSDYDGKVRVISFWGDW